MAVHSENRRLATKLATMALAMFGFGYLMVPLYDIICEVTGLNGKTGVVSSAVAASYDVDPNRQVRVEFSATVNTSGSWVFEPIESEMFIRPGETYTTSFRAVNRSTQAVIGQAVPSVAPAVASRFFSKTECFCFTPQPFEAGESKDMPVTFVVAPDLPPTVDVITLSYTFFAKPPA